MRGPSFLRWSETKYQVFGVGLLVFLALLVPSACGSGAEGTSGTRVIASNVIIGDLVRNVAGDAAEVTVLIPQGTDPHTFQPTARQARDVARADVVFLNGKDLEEAAESLVRNNVSDDTPVITLADSVAEAADDPNPHLWLNARYAMQYVEAIRDALVDADPEQAATYRANAARYLDELDALDREVEQQIRSIPEERRKLVTFHDSFHYLAERYGLTVVGVVLESPGREASARDLVDLVAEIKEQRVPAVFAEPQLDDRLLREAATEAGATLADLYSDAFGEGVQSYVELMRYDAQQLVRYLGS